METFSSIALADIQSNLLLFSSTQTNSIYNNQLQIVKNGENINLTRGQSNNIFIPKPNNDTLVYIISLSNYSVIDAKNDTVINKNIRWNNLNEILNMYAVHSNNCNDVWLITRTQNGLYSYLISKTGISEDFVYSARQNPANKGSISPSGRFYVMPANVTNAEDSVLIDYGKFDRSTGQFTNSVFYKFIDYKLCFAASFSKDEKKLYLFVLLRDTRTYHTLQVDIINSIPDFENSVIVSSQNIQGFVAYSDMQLGIDGKIYHTFFLEKKICIIHNPELSGTNCNYEDNAIPLTAIGANSPFFVSTWLSGDFCITDIFSENVCFSEPSNFKINTTLNIQSTLWHLGDTQTSTDLSPTHIYTQAGKYTVSVEITYTDDTTETISKEIEIYEKPEKPIIKYNVE